MKVFYIAGILLYFALPLFAGGIVCDMDLTKQSAGGCATIRAGEFKDGGWVASNAGRVLYTHSKPIKKGWAQVNFIVDNISTSLQNKDKCIFFSVYDCAAIAQNSCPNRQYVRIRKESSRPYYIEYKGFDPNHGGEGETRLKSRSDWNNWKGKEVHIKFTWGAGELASMEYPKQDGSGYATTGRGDLKCTDIKYVVVGADGSYNCTFTGFRYTRLQVYDEAGTGATSSAEHAMSSNSCKGSVRIAGDHILFSSAEGRTYSIYDLRGNMLVKATGSSPLSIDKHSLPSGQYYLHVSGKDAGMPIPFVVQ